MTTEHPLRKYRTDRGISQEMLGRMVGRSWITIYRWEKGKMPLKRDWAAIKKATGIEPAELIEYVSKGAA
jgi:predicted transcriptional regulator